MIDTALACETIPNTGVQQMKQIEAGEQDVLADELTHGQISWPW